MITYKIGRDIGFNRKYKMVEFREKRSLASTFCNMQNYSLQSNFSKIGTLAWTVNWITRAYYVAKILETCKKRLTDRLIV